MPQTCDRPIVEDCAKYLVARLPEGTVSRTRLTALLYLADRQHILNYGHSLADDRFGSRDGKPYGVGTNRVVAVLLANEASLTIDELNHISKAIETTLEDIVETYGGMPDGALDAALRSLPEADEPGPFSYRRLGIHLGDKDPDAFDDIMETSRALRWCFERLR
ncbi:hypothetical protein O9X98_04870 [Agrobacterium salinitolerans]|nr:hypothetical protein [Agrobacterium salinitolerans]